MFKTIFSTVNKINEGLTRSQKKYIAALLVLMLFSSVMEAFGISLIIPYFAVLTDPQTFLTGTFGAVISKVLSTSYNINYGLRRGSQPRLFPSQSRSC